MVSECNHLQKNSTQNLKGLRIYHSLNHTPLGLSMMNLQIYMNAQLSKKSLQTERYIFKPISKLQKCSTESTAYFELPK